MRSFIRGTGMIDRGGDCRGLVGVSRILGLRIFSIRIVGVSVSFFVCIVIEICFSAR